MEGIGIEPILQISRPWFSKPAPYRSGNSPSGNLRLYSSIIINNKIVVSNSIDNGKAIKTCVKTSGGENKAPMIKQMIILSFLLFINNPRFSNFKYIKKNNTTGI
jgi:hypothetical protein